MVLSGASIVPGLVSVCTALKAVVGVAQTVPELATDALEMTESVLEIGRYLIDLQQLAKRMKEQIDTELDHHMGRLAELVVVVVVVVVMVVVVVVVGGGEWR
jgi:hypothetical protein